MTKDFKLTDFGEIPYDWDLKTLVDIAEVTSSKRIHQSDYLTGGIPFYRGKEITNKSKGEALNDLVYIDEQLFNDLALKFGAPKTDDILITAVGTIGTIYLVKKGEKFYFKDGNLIWLRNIKKIIDSAFLCYLLSSNIFQQLIAKISSGSSQKALTIVKLTKLNIPIPPIHEQRGIANVLSTVDDKINNITAQIAETETLKQGLMKQLFTRGIRHTEFKHTELGEIPLTWEVVTLESISAFITKGSTPTTYGFEWVSEPGITFLRSECVSKGGFSLTGSMFISEEANKVMVRSQVCPGDVLMTITGNVGRVCMLPENILKANINQHIARIRVECKTVTPDFVYQFLSQPSLINSYNKITTGQAYPQLSLKQVRETKIVVPPLAEQAEISEILDAVDNKLFALKKRKKLYIQLKTGVMEQLLTGKLRVDTYKSESAVA